MARVDYEAAFTALARSISEREGWGTDTLLAEMQKVAIKHEIPEDFIEKAARLYGTLPYSQSVPGTPADTPEAAAPPEGKPGDPGPSKVRSRDERRAAGHTGADPPQHPGRTPAGGSPAATPERTLAPAH